MTIKKLLSWIGYWDRASFGPTLSAVRSLSDMATCRQFNPCMSNGLMSDVTDAAMWEALRAYRGDAA